MVLSRSEEELIPRETVSNRRGEGRGEGTMKERAADGQPAQVRQRDSFKASDERDQAQLRDDDGYKIERAHHPNQHFVDRQQLIKRRPTTTMAVINFASTIASLPLATRTLTGLVLAFSLFLFLLRVFRTDEPLHFITFTRNDSAIAFPWLVIVPGVSFWYPWTLITSAFCETSFIEFIITVVSLPLAGRYLERIWGAKELIRFTLVVVVGSNIIAWFIATALFVVLRSETAL